MPKRTYDQVKRILSRSNNTQKLGDVNTTKYKALIDFEADIDDFFDKNPAYKAKYGKDNLTAEKISEIYYDYKTNKLELDNRYERELKLVENQKNGYLKGRQNLRAERCGGDSKVYDDAKNVEKDKANIQKTWDSNKKALAVNGDKNDPRLGDFNEVFSKIQQEMDAYTGNNFLADFYNRTRKDYQPTDKEKDTFVQNPYSEEYYDSVCSIIDYIGRQKEADKIIDKYEMDLGDGKLIDRVRENEKNYDKETQREVKDYYDTLTENVNKGYNAQLEKAGNKFARVKDLCADYAEKFGGKTEENKDSILRIKQRDNVSQVLKMRNDLVNEYNNTSWFSRLANSIPFIPKSWSNAGKIQTKLDELDKAMLDSGYSKDVADQLVSEKKHGDKIPLQNEQRFASFYKSSFIKNKEGKICESISGAKEVIEAVTELGNGNLYSESGADYLDQIINAGKYALESENLKINEKDSAFTKEFKKQLKEYIILARDEAKEVSSKLTGEPIPEDDIIEPANEKDEDFKDLDENFVKDVNGLENKEKSEQVKENVKNEKVKDLE